VPRHFDRRQLALSVGRRELCRRQLMNIDHPPEYILAALR
jgi:hypothetical protein